jgi:hypothetical protein
LPDGENEVVIQAEDEAGHQTETSVTLRVDNTKPSIMIEYDPSSSVMMIKVEDAHLYVTNVYANRTLVNGFMHNQDVSAESFEVSFTSSPLGTYNIIIDSKDKVENLGTEHYTIILEEANSEMTIDPVTTSEPSIQTETETTTSTQPTTTNLTTESPITSGEVPPTEQPLTNTTTPEETTIAGPVPIISKNSLSIPVIILGSAGIVLAAIKQSGLLNGGIRRFSRRINGRQRE